MRFLQWEQVLGVKLPLKSQTRRLVKEGEFLLADRVWTGTTDLWDTVQTVYDHNGHIKWQTGRTYACQRPDGKTMGRTPKIKTIRRERLGDINEDDCWAEGIALGQTFDYTQGIPFDCYDCPICQFRYFNPQSAFRCLWEHVYGPGAWDRMKNDDVWVLEFEVFKTPQGSQIEVSRCAAGS